SGLGLLEGDAVVGVTLDVSPPRARERIRARQQTLREEGEHEAADAAFAMSSGCKQSVPSPAVRAQGFHETVLLRGPGEVHTGHAALGEREGLAATLGAVVQLRLETAHHDE